MIFEQGKKIVFVGDSITDSGRRDVAVPFGNGYVSMVRNFIVARYPGLSLTFVNRGVSGNTARDLAMRWESDVIAERPDYLVLCVGINDVYRQFHGDPATAVYPQEYESTCRRLLLRAREASNPRFVLMTPYMIESNRSQLMRAQIDAYGAIVARLAAEFDAVLVRLQEAFDSALRVTTPAFWSDDQFHVNGPGASLIAQTFLRATGFSMT
jgi:lysophospholipase L1-like esterase